NLTDTLHCAETTCSSSCRSRLATIGQSPNGFCYGVPDFDGTCNACLTSNCCAELAACQNDPACVKSAVCVSRCHGDIACIAGCLEHAPLGQFRQVMRCNANNCATTCSSVFGTNAGNGTCFPLPGIARQCDSCITSHCCNQLAACENSDK